MERKGMLLVSVMAMIVAVSSGFAQTTEQDPAIAKAKEETVVVYDLGRFFGYVLTVEEESPKLALSRSQLEEFYDVMSAIRSMTRVEPEWASEMLDRLELDVLTVDQLIAVDELAIERQSSREEGTTESTSQQKGGGTASGPLQTYVAGGAFNPIVDETKSLGEGFAELYSYIAKKLGK